MCVAYPARVLEIHGDVALVTANGHTQRVPLVAVDEPVGPGDWLLVQTGLALGHIDADEAAGRIALLEGTS